MAPNETVIAAAHPAVALPVAMHRAQARVAAPANVDSQAENHDRIVAIALDALPSEIERKADRAIVANVGLTAAVRKKALVIAPRVLPSEIDRKANRVIVANAGLSAAVRKKALVIAPDVCRPLAAKEDLIGIGQPDAGQMARHRQEKGKGRLGVCLGSVAIRLINMRKGRSDCRKFWLRQGLARVVRANC
jgi:hypothetical protein